MPYKQESAERCKILSSCNLFACLILSGGSVGADAVFIPDVDVGIHRFFTQCLMTAGVTFLSLPPTCRSGAACLKGIDSEETRGETGCLVPSSSSPSSSSPAIIMLTYVLWGLRECFPAETPFRAGYLRITLLSTRIRETCGLTDRKLRNVLKGCGQVCVLSLETSGPFQWVRGPGLFSGQAGWTGRAACCGRPCVSI